MNELYSKIQSFLGIKSSRTKNVTKHVLFSLLYKGGHIIATFLLVPLTIHYLDTENYGIWLTLSSFIAWFSFFDVGLGNGLRNKFAEARANNDKELAKGYVSTAYYTIGGVCLLFLCVSLTASYYINWTEVFNTSNTMQRSLGILMPIVFACFSLQLIFKLITSIYTGDQNHSIQGKIGFFIAGGSLLLVWLLTQTSQSSLVLFGTIFSLLPVVILLGFNIYAFYTKYIEYIPRLKYCRKVHLKEIFGLGFSFFIIQISVIVMFSTDNFIITQLFGPEEVVPFNIAYKYIGIAQMLFVIVLTPYWSSITEAYAKGEMSWIKKSMKNLNKFSLLFIISIFIMVLIAPFAYNIWIGKLVVVPFILTISMAVFFVFTVLYSPYTYFINGTGKVRLQMYTLAIMAIINIPLSVVLVKYTALGVEGVILATTICVTPHLILCPIQYSKIINKKAYGIWNK